MEQMISQYQPYMAVVGAVYVLFSAIAFVTPTKKDDKIVSYFDKFGALADRIGLNVKPKK